MTKYCKNSLSIHGSATFRNIGYTEILVLCQSDKMIYCFESRHATGPTTMINDPLTLRLTVRTGSLAIAFLAADVKRFYRNPETI